MAQISHADKEIKLKVVYYGPALSGKTTNLIYVHQVLFPNQKVKLFSINTGDDRTLFFDLLPLELGRINGYDMKLQLFTVPGQVRYNQTRRAVLSKADGVVFVADSQKKELDANQESFSNLKENMVANHLDFATIPIVIQYNKQDAEDIYHPLELDKILNERHAPYFGAIAITGVGVLQTLKQTILHVLASFNRNFPDFSVAAIEDTIDRSFEMVLETYQKKTHGPGTVADPEESLRAGLNSAAHNIKVKESRESITQEQLLEKAVETNIEMAELYNELNATKNLVDQRNRELAILGQVAEALTAEFNPEQLPRMLFKSILMTFQTTHGAVLEFSTQTRRLQELFISGFNRDPLASIALAPGSSLANYLYTQKKPFSFNVFSFEDVNLPGKRADVLAAELKKLRIMAFMSVPVRSSGLEFGLMNIYQMINESSVLKAYGSEELKFMARLGAPLSLAFEKLFMSRKVLNIDEAVQVKVEERAAESELKLEELRQLNRNLADRLQRAEVMLTPVLRLEKRREQVFRGFKSDISKIVSSMLMAAKLLDKFGISSQENLDRFMNVIRDESGRLTASINNFDTGSSRYFDDSDFQHEVFQLESVMAEVRESLEPLARQKKLEWTEEIPARLPALAGDRRLISFVIRQLAENALQFTISGQLEFKVQYDPVYNSQFVVLTVRDTGIGISRDNLPRIFDRFYRESEDLVAVNGNYGIGLSFCKEIVEHFGGRIWVKSEEGAGTTFFAELPVQKM